MSPLGQLAVSQTIPQVETVAPPQLMFVLAPPHVSRNAALRTLPGGEIAIADAELSGASISTATAAAKDVSRDFLLSTEKWFFTASVLYSGVPIQGGLPPCRPCYEPARAKNREFSWHYGRQYDRHFP